MKLSNDTKEVLKNYATINANLLVSPGNKIATMSQMKNIVSTATVSDTFDTDFAIYDLNEFLSALSLFNDPELTFNDQSVRIAQGSQDLTYFYSDPSVVTTPKTEISMPSVDASFTLTRIHLIKYSRRLQFLVCLIWFLILVAIVSWTCE